MLLTIHVAISKNSADGSASLLSSLIGSSNCSLYVPTAGNELQRAHRYLLFL
jgi:hypothetical protein